MVIPTFNEEGRIEDTVLSLNLNSSSPDNFEVIIADGGSTDKTIAVANEIGARIVVTEKGRGHQLHEGARIAEGRILYFLHSDTHVPSHWDLSILNEVDRGNTVGCFRMKFSPEHPILNFYSFFTRFNWLLFRGGDQSLFVEKAVYQNSGGFDTAFKVMEDIEFIDRLSTKHSIFIIPKEVVSSSRRYFRRGIVKLQLHYAVMHILYRWGAKNKTLESYYHKHIS